MAYTIPSVVLDSFKTAHSSPSNPTGAPASQQQLADWAVQQQFISPAQANEFLGRPATAAAAPTTAPTGSGFETVNLSGLVNPPAGGTTVVPTTGQPAVNGPIPANNSSVPSGTVVPPLQGPATGTNVPTVNGPAQSTPQTGGAGKMTFDQAVALFRQSVPGADLSTPQGQATFNQWSSTTFGAGGWENAPASSAGQLTNPASNTSLKLFGDLPSQVGEAKSVLDNMTGGQGDTNAAQVQGSNQTGAFQTGGTTATTGTQTQAGSNKTTATQDQNTLNNTVGTQTGSTTGATDQTTQGTTTQAGLNLSKPIDTLGFGDLLKGQMAGAVGDTNTNRAFLTDLVQNGPKQQEALTQQAVRNSLTGPQMTGAGDSARARAAGYAGELVERNSLNHQLQAASQLAGPTAVTQLSTAANPYVGQSNLSTNTTGVNSNVKGTNTGATTNTSNVTNTGTNHSVDNSLNLTDLVNNTSAKTDENQSGVSNAGSVQAGLGKQPLQTTSSGGGCYVCTAYVKLGWMYKHTVARAARWKLSQLQYRRSLMGYSLYGPFLAKLILRSPLFAKLFFPVACAVLREELRFSGLDIIESRWDSFCHGVFDHGSRWLAVITRTKRVKQCDATVTRLLQQHNLLFPCLFG